jgi:trk system potassium uptake protein
MTRAFSLVLVSLAIIFCVLFMLLVGYSLTDWKSPALTHSFLSYLFETVSAFGTVGLSMGVTPDLSIWGKYWIIFMMVIGRVGVLTFAYIVVGTHASEGIVHSEENVMIG